MKKRIRLHQLRTGMLVTELEWNGSAGTAPALPLLISSPLDVDHLMRAQVISVVIDTRRGADTGGAGRYAGGFSHVQFETDLLSKFSARQVENARQTIENTAPHVRRMLSDIRMGAAIQFEGASQTVESLMAAAGQNSAALIGLSRLKERDQVTFLHSIAVSALMIDFGRSLKLDEEAIHLLGIGGLLHDFGKMLLPRAILNKKGTLTEAERLLVRSHPLRGYELLKRAENMPQTVLDICLYHHEQYDGTGYPRGLQGADIPRPARIAAICDVYEAMTTIRPYKRAWTQSEAIGFMLDSPGHFDPELLQNFVSRMVVGGVLA